MESETFFAQNCCVALCSSLYICMCIYLSLSLGSLSCRC